MKEKIIQIVRENYSEPDFNVNKLSEILTVCRTYLYRCTIKHFDCSPHELIDNFRIKKALELLSNGEKIIYTAIKTGFVNGYNLRRAFKKRMGITPSDFKEKCDNAENIEDVLYYFMNSLK